MGSAREEQVFVKKAFRKFFVPSVLSSLGLAVGGLADCFFVGSQIGADGLAAIGFGAPIYALYSLISVGISTGASIHYSVALSEGDEKRGKDIFHNTLLFNFLILLVLSALGCLFLPQVLSVLGVSRDSAIYPLVHQYAGAQLCFGPIMFMQAPFYYFVHSDNNPKLAAAALVTANIVDVVLNYLLIVVLKVGIVGAVYSTVCAAVVTISLCMLHLFSRKTVLGFGRFHICVRHVTDGIKTGYASNAQYAYRFIVLLVFNQLLMRIGGELGVACLDVAINVCSLVAAVIEGVGLTLQPMISTFYGERNARNIRSTLRYAYISGGVVCLVFLVLLWFPAPSYCPMFGLTEGEALSGGTWAVWMYLLSLPVHLVISVMVYYYQTVERERLAYVLIFLSEAAGRILFGGLLSCFGFYAFWFCFLCSDLLTLLILVCYCSYKRSILFLNFKEAVFSAFIQNQAEEIAGTIEQIQEFCEQQGASIKQSYYVTMAVDEVCSTIFKRQTRQEICIQLTVVREGEENFILHLRDNNQDDFNPFDTDTTDIVNEAENENAIGMRFVKGKAKEFFYRQYSGFNTLVVKI